jgi:hypothetical protein
VLLSHERGELLAASREETNMLWLLIGIILLVIAIAGGVVVHPLLFVLGILALAMFFFGGSHRTV